MIFLPKPTANQIILVYSVKKTYKNNFNIINLLTSQPSSCYGNQFLTSYYCVIFIEINRQLELLLRL